MGVVLLLHQDLAQEPHLVTGFGGEGEVFTDGGEDNLVSLAPPPAYA
jgi:hypothetical protein